MECQSKGGMSEFDKVIEELELEETTERKNCCRCQKDKANDEFKEGRKTCMVCVCIVKMQSIKKTRRTEIGKIILHHANTNTTRRN